MTEPCDGCCCRDCCNFCAPELPEFDLDETQPIDLSTYPPYLAELRQLAKDPDEQP